jgi:hypothetical protein
LVYRSVACTILIRYSADRRPVFSLDKGAIRQWTRDTRGMSYPESVDTLCPHCDTLANFATEDVQYDSSRNTTSATATCSACRQGVYLWYVDATDLYIRPAPRTVRKPIVGAELMPAAVRQAYQDTVDVFNAGVWSATATATRRTLEGIVNNLLPDEKGPLAQQIRELADSASVDLSQPLITLSNSLRQGGNIGAHFDLERVPDRAVAEAMLELIEYLIEYLYTLPNKIEELDLRIQRLGSQESG